MACIRTYVTLRIFSESFDVGAIGAALNLAPTSIRLRDALSSRRFERERVRYGSTRPKASWTRWIRKIISIGC